MKFLKTIFKRLRPSKRPRAVQVPISSRKPSQALAYSPQAPSERGLGRRIPTDWQHVEKWRASEVLKPVPSVEVILPDAKSWWTFFDQGQSGGCVGYGCSRMMALLNRKRYDAKWLWDEARLIDEWPANDDLSDDSQGTSVRAACEVLRTKGHVPWRPSYGSATTDQRITESPIASEGISAYRWATTVDEVRASIAVKTPVALGINWYAAFDNPSAERRGKSTWEAWIGKGDLGKLRGGHCICVGGASDERQAVACLQSWGRAYPRLVWLPYLVLERLLNESGEASLVTDR